MYPVILAEKFAQFSDHWNPRLIGEVNDFQVKAVKVLGTFDWHRHETEDEMFLVVRGVLTMRFRDHEVQVGPGAFIVVPAGVEHQPHADAEVEMLLIERAGVVNTGDKVSERTRTVLERL